MRQFSHFLSQIQGLLFPALEESWGPLTEIEQRVISSLEVIQIEKFLASPPKGLQGRPQADRRCIARAFLAKHVCDFKTTRALRRQLCISPRLRRACGWERAGQVPGEATFSRVFHEFAEMGLLAKVHESLVKENLGEILVGHVSRDSTAIEVRERSKRKRKTEAKKRRRSNGDRIKRQAQGMSVDEMLKELPTDCDYGCKTNSRGNLSFWCGYKLHVDFADGGIPLSCVLTSASTHDSQAAIPLASLTFDRVTNLYDLMDSAYDSEVLREHSASLGHVPIIEQNSRGKNSKRNPLPPAQRSRLAERTTAERGFSRLKDSFGARHIYVRGAAKVFTHLMFAILALTADALIRYVQ